MGGITNMQIAICDDNQMELENLTQLLRAYTNTRDTALSIHPFSSGFDLLHNFKGGEYDLILLDILMPGINGIQIANEIRQWDKNVQLVFLTSSSEFAVESYSVNACSYLLKPATAKTIYPLLDTIKNSIIHSKNDYLLIKDKKAITRIRFAQLEYVEVMNKTVFFHMVDGSIRETFSSLSEFEDILLSRNNFYKVHRSYIVNLQYIQNLSHKGAITYTGHTIPVSRIIYAQIKEAYMCFLFQPKQAEEPKLQHTKPKNISTGSAYQILLIDDETEQLAFWKELFERKGCAVTAVNTISSLLQHASSTPWDCILLDVLLNGNTSFELCQNLQSMTDAPIIFFSCLTDSESQLKGFASGGIDFITKDTPFELFWTKIETRIRLSRSNKMHLQFGPLHISISQHKAFLSGTSLTLTATEYDILLLLAENVNQTFIPSELSKTIFGKDSQEEILAIHTHLAHLKRKLEKAAPEFHFIESVWGEGYRFNFDDAVNLSM